MGDKSASSEMSWWLGGDGLRLVSNIQYTKAVNARYRDIVTTTVPCYSSSGRTFNRRTNASACPTLSEMKTVRKKAMRMMSYLVLML